MQFTGLALRAVAKDQSLAGRESQPGAFSKIAHVFDARLAEFHDQEWFPKVLRDHVTDALQFIFNLVRIYKPIVPRLSEAICAAKSEEVVDLCSGGGGPWMWLQKSLQHASGLPLRICITDKYPNIRAFEDLQQQSQGQVTYRTDSVDAAHLPCGLLGFRTIFTSFHHAQPEEALLILQDAVRTRQGIGVFEAASRNPITLFSTMLMFFGGFLAAPFIRPFRLSRWFWTYLIPVIPLVLFFDGVISCLRAYSKQELADLVSKIEAEDYVWEIGEERSGLTPITYLVGYPK
jgi:hypothetical protein